MKWIKWSEAVPEESKTNNNRVIAATDIWTRDGRKIEVDEMFWSDEHGWNTTPGDDGSTAIENDGHYVLAWMYFPKYEGEA